MGNDDQSDLSEGDWWVLDPRPTQRENKYTFYLPSTQETAAIEVGDVVKLLFEGFGTDGDIYGERMWVVCEEKTADGWVGQLDNAPCNIQGLAAGDRVLFQPEYVMDTYYARVDGPSDLDQYLDRCHLDRRILIDRAPVVRLERRKPRWVWMWTRKDDEYPDTGWHIFGPDPANGETVEMEYVAIGRALNVDDGFIDLRDTPVGTKLEKRGEGFERV